MSKRSNWGSITSGKPTLREMASFLATVAGVTHHPGALGVATWLIGESEEARGMLRAIETLADDAGLRMSASAAFEATSLEEALDRLLAAKATTQGKEILDPSSDEEIDYAKILRMVKSRLRRGQGEAAALQALERKLKGLEPQAT